MNRAERPAKTGVLRESLEQKMLPWL